MKLELCLRLGRKTAGQPTYSPRAAQYFLHPARTQPTDAWGPPISQRPRAWYKLHFSSDRQADPACHPAAAATNPAPCVNLPLALRVLGLPASRIHLAHDRCVVGPSSQSPSLSQGKSTCCVDFHRELGRPLRDQAPRHIYALAPHLCCRIANKLRPNREERRGENWARASCKSCAATYLFLAVGRSLWLGRGGLRVPSGSRLWHLWVESTIVQPPIAHRGWVAPRDSTPPRPHICAPLSLVWLPSAYSSSFPSSIAPADSSLGQCVTDWAGSSVTRRCVPACWATTRASLGTRCAALIKYRIHVREILILGVGVELGDPF
jgi:hypothetical protein